MDNNKPQNNRKHENQDLFQEDSSTHQQPDRKLRDNGNPENRNRLEVNLLQSNNQAPQERIKSPKQVILRIIIFSMGSYTFGYSWAIYNQLFHKIKHIYHWPHEQETWISGGINSMFIFTAIFGSLALSSLKNFSRLNMMRILDVSAIVGSLCLLVVNNYFFVLGRVVQGFIAGANSALVPLFIKEYAPLSMFSKFSVLITLSIVFGQVSSFLIGAPVDFVESIAGIHYWRFCILPCITLPLLRIILSSNWAFDTPAHYLLSHDAENAYQALSEIYEGAEFLDWKLESEKKLLQWSEKENTTAIEEEPGELQEPGFCQILCKSPNLKIVLIGVCIFFNQQFAGINAVNFYSTSIFTKLGSGIATWMTAVWGLIDLASVTCSLFFVIPNYGRKKLLMYGIVALVVLLFLIGYVSTTEKSILAVFFMILYIISFNCCMGPLAWVIISESTDSRLIGLPISSHWVFAFFIAQFFPVFVDDSVLGLGWTFFSLGLLTMVSGIVLMAYLVESKDLDRRKIIEAYHGNKGIVQSELDELAKGGGGSHAGAGVGHVIH